MAHFTLEYTRNLTAEGDVPGLLRAVNRALLAQDGVFPPGGIRSRAIELEHWCMADDAEDYAFAHATLKIGGGRDPTVVQAAADAVFAAMKTHFAALYAKRWLALSMELHEFDERGTWKHNNVHARFRAGTAP